MTISDARQKRLIVLIAVEKGHRIDEDSWTQDGVFTNCWWISHTNVIMNVEREGKPSRVEENGVEYTEQESLEDCDGNPGSWWWDSSNKRLYIHATGSDDPGGGGYIILSFIWMRFGTKPHVFEGKPHLARIRKDSISEISFSTGGYHEGGTRQTFTSVSLINMDGFFDQEFSDYIWEAKALTGWFGENGAPDEEFTIFMNQWTGNLAWSDKQVTLSVEDLRKCVI